MIILFSLFLSVFLHPHDWDWNADSSDANARSTSLEDKVNNMRDEVALSLSLRFLAQLHCDDLEFRWHHWFPCDGYHTWSDDGGPWSPLCDDDDDHTEDSHMAYKAFELSHYTSTAHVTEAIIRITDGDATASKCKQAFLYSSHSKDIIYNRGTYAPVTWEAMGCAYSKQFCSCWFGDVGDSLQRDFTCQGVAATSSNVCGGGAGEGICVAYNNCLEW